MIAPSVLCSPCSTPDRRGAGVFRGRRAAFHTNVSYVWGLAALALGSAALGEEITVPASIGFRGRIAPLARDSVPSWPDLPKAPDDAPDIVLILLDDAGFGATGTFGGTAQTPALDRLAAHGLRYNHFHVTGICSPSRAALLSGRNHHRVGFGTIADWAAGYPGYDGIWTKRDISLPELLRRHGYSTAAFGKWHNTPLWEINPSGPFDRWPTGLGFEYFYGFLQGAVNQFEPPLYRNTTPVDPTRTVQQGYHLTADLADDAIHWLRLHEATAPHKPYFLYFAPGATHAPHQVPSEWINRYAGKFDQGWDRLREEVFARQKRLGVIPADTELTPRPAEFPAWNSLSPVEKRLFAREAEIYAGFVAQTDYEVGRLLDVVRNQRRADNTLILYIAGDNGASGEGGVEGTNTDATLSTGVPAQSPGDMVRDHFDALGGPSFYTHYASAWAWADDTPFQWCKQVASHLGATRDPLVVSWPARIKDPGSIREQFTHLIDIAPTIYDLLGISLPAEIDGVPEDRLDGFSFAASFVRPDAVSTHRIQYFEILGNRAIYQDGWMASARHTLPWEVAGRTDDYAHDRWELYDLTRDFSQARDLASMHPDKLAELKRLFDDEAKANFVYPLVSARIQPAFKFDGRPNAGFQGPDPHSQLGVPQPLNSTMDFIYYADTPRIPNSAAPDFSRGGFSLSARLQIPPGGAEGVIFSHGGAFGGDVLYVRNDRLIYQNNFFGRSYDTIISRERIPRGEVEAKYLYIRKSTDPWGGGQGQLYLNGQLAGEGRVTHYWPWETMGIGRQYGSPVTPAYDVPFAFTGQIRTVTIHLAPTPTALGTIGERAHPDNGGGAPAQAVLIDR